MSISGFSRSALSTFAAVAMLSGCGGSGTPLSPSPAGPSTTTAERAQKLPAFHLLYSFKGGTTDGQNPRAALTNVDGMLYGTTAGGGANCFYAWACGTVFTITASGKETVLYSFGGGTTDGSGPGSLINVNGTLYGTTDGGGTYNAGTVFAITTSGKETVLYSFEGGPADGAEPVAPLLNVNGILYGTTWMGGSGSSCGSDGCGTVFSITTSGKESVLYSFKGGTTDGKNPLAGLLYVRGKLYGTTYEGGTNCEKGLSCGTVFSITRSGKETVLYRFKGGTTDGRNPKAALINVNGKLYGTTASGGSSSYSDGTVFAITTSGNETVLHSFRGYPNDGAAPEAALLDMNGMLYGTTADGGSSYDEFGTAFEISTSGKERVLHNFGGGADDGAAPAASLINVNGTLHGTSDLGGSGYCPNSGYHGCGTVFSLEP